MTLKTFLFNGTNGADITAANTGGTMVVGPASGLNTAKFTTTDAFEGATGVRFTTATGGNFNGSQWRGNLTAPSTSLATSLVVTIPANNVSFPFMEFRTTADTRTYQLLWNGQLVLVSKINNEYKYVTAVGALTNSTKYRIEVGATVAGTGAATIKVYTMAGTLVTSASFTDITNDNTPISTIALGIISTSVAAIGFDTLQVNDGTTAEIGPYGGSAPSTVIQPISVTSSVGTWAGTINALVDNLDSTFVQSPTANSTEYKYMMRLAPIQTPSTFSLTVRLALSSAVTNTTRARLYQGTVVKKEWTITPTTSFSDVTLTLNTAEIATITDWSALDFEVLFLGTPPVVVPPEQLNTPDALPNLAHWLHAADLNLTDGAPVISWPDRVDGTATQTVTANQPVFRTAGINGKPAVQFNGSQLMTYGPTVTIPAQYTVYAVCHMTTFVTGAGPVGLDVTNASPRVFQLKHNAVDGMQFVSFHSNGGTNNTDGTPIPSGKQLTPALMSGQRSATEVRAYWNGYSDGPATIATGTVATTTTAGPLVIGSSARGNIQLFTGYISDIIIYNEAHDDTKRAKILAWADARYSVAGGTVAPPATPTYAAPTNVTAVEVDGNKVRVDWTIPANAIATEVWESNTATRLARIEAPVSTRTSGVLAYGDYFYRVRAEYPDGGLSPFVAAPKVSPAGVVLPPTEPSDPDPTDPTDPTDFVSGITKPGPTNTGVGIIAAAPTTVHSGDYNLTGSNQTVQNLIITGRLIVTGANNTVRNCKIQGSNITSSERAVVQTTGGTGTIIEFCEIYCSTGWGGANGVGNRNFTLRRSNIHHTVDPIRINNEANSANPAADVAVTIADNWIHDVVLKTPDPLYARSDNKTHSDNIQIEGGANILITGNRIDGYHSTDGTSNVVNVDSSGKPVSSGGTPHPQSGAAIMLSPRTTAWRISNLTINNNWIYGGEISISGASGLNSSTTGTINRNRFDRGQFWGGNTQVYLASSATGLVTGTAANANVFEDTGLPVTVRRV